MTLRSRFDLPRVEDAYDEKLISDVRTYGWHAVGVDRTHGTPQFMYSVGLYLTHDHPEIIVIGLPQGVAHALLTNVVRAVARGHRFQPNIRYADIVAGHDVMFRTVAIENYRDFLGYALWFYRSLLPDPFPVLQLVWPDKDDRFPWEEGCDPNLSSIQYLLEEPT